MNKNPNAKASMGRSHSPQLESRYPASASSIFFVPFSSFPLRPLRLEAFAVLSEDVVSFATFAVFLCALCG